MKLFILIGFIVLIAGCAVEEVIEPVIEDVEQVAESPLVNKDLTDEEILEQFDDDLDAALEDLDSI